MGLKSEKVNDLTKQAIIAALYAVICIALAPISYGEIQLRAAEMLMVLPFYNKKHTIGLTLGCFLANLFSPIGLPDIIFGTLATFIACVLIVKFKKLALVAPIAAGVNGVIVGAMLHIVFDVPLLLTMAAVALGQLASVYAGIIVMKLLEKNSAVRQFLYS